MIQWDEPEEQNGSKTLSPQSLSRTSSQKFIGDKRKEKEFTSDETASTSNKKMKTLGNSLQTWPDTTKQNQSRVQNFDLNQDKIIFEEIRKIKASDRTPEQKKTLAKLRSRLSRAEKSTDEKEVEKMKQRERMKNLWKEGRYCL